MNCTKNESVTSVVCSKAQRLGNSWEDSEMILLVAFPS